MLKILTGVFAALTLLSSGPQPAAGATVDFGTLSPGDVRSLATNNVNNVRFSSGSGEQVLDNFLFKVSTAANVESNGTSFDVLPLNIFFSNLTAELIEGT